MEEPSLQPDFIYNTKDHSSEQCGTKLKQTNRIVRTWRELQYEI